MLKKNTAGIEIPSDHLMVKILCIKSKVIIDRYFVANNIKADQYQIDIDQVDLPQPLVTRIRATFEKWQAESKYSTSKNKKTI